MTPIKKPLCTSARHPILWRQRAGSRGNVRPRRRRPAMVEEIRHPDGRIEHPSVRHEPTDASFRWVLGVVIGAAILGVIIHYVILAYFNHSKDVLAERRKSSFP